LSSHPGAVAFGPLMSRKFRLLGRGVSNNSDFAGRCFLSLSLYRLLFHVVPRRRILDQLLSPCGFLYNLIFRIPSFALILDEASPRLFWHSPPFSPQSSSVIIWCCESAGRGRMFPPSRTRCSPPLSSISSSGLLHCRRSKYR